MDADDSDVTDAAENPTEKKLLLCGDKCERDIAPMWLMSPAECSAVAGLF